MENEMRVRRRKAGIKNAFKEIKRGANEIGVEGK
jgi:hypothetical protein